MPIAPWRSPLRARGLRSRAAGSTITREASAAYTTPKPLRWIGFLAAAVGHRKAGASVGHRKIGVWPPYLRSACESGKAPRSDDGPFAGANDDAQGVSAHPAVCRPDVFLLLSRSDQRWLCRADDEQGYRP